MGQVRVAFKLGFRVMVIFSFLFILVFSFSKLSGEAAKHKTVKQDPGINIIMDTKTNDQTLKIERADNIYGKKPSGLRNRVIFYNKVPKTGSTTVCLVMKKLSQRGLLKTVYKCRPSKEYPIFNASESVQKAVAEQVNSLQRPSIYHKHFPVQDFHKFDMEQPVYINTIRDPLERTMSEYYFLRFAKVKETIKFTDQEKYMTFEECIIKGHYDGEHYDPAEQHINGFWASPEGDCSTQTVFQARYFCGHDKVCGTNSLEAVAKAKHNLMTMYTVVGINEDLKAFFQVTESLMPSVFKGAKNIYLNWHNRSEVRRNQNPITEKPSLSKETLDIVKIRYALDYDVYHFAKQVFVDLAKRLDISTSL